MSDPAHVLSIVRAPGHPAVVLAPASRLKTAPAHLIRRSIARVRATVSVPAPVDHVSWHAPSVGDTRVDALRERLLEGWIHVHRSPESPLGRVRALAGFQPTDSLRVTASGGLRQFGRAGDRGAMLRLGTVDSPADPLPHVRALERFADPLVPELLGSGTVAGVRWSIESLLPGARPRTVSPPLLAAVSGFLTSLARPGGGSADAIARVATVLEPIDPARFDIGRLVRRSRRTLDEFPAVVSHGDLWAGNLLVDDDGNLSGVIDWDSWSERGVPGVDLLHLFAEHRRRAHRTSYGGVVEARFWEDPTVSAAIDSHMRMVGVDWDVGLLTDLAIAWWITTVAGAVGRSPALLAEPQWLAENVVRPHHVFLDDGG